MLFLWCFLFNPHQTTYHSNIGIRLRRETKKHMHTLCLHSFLWVFWMSWQIPMYFVSPIFNTMLCMLWFQKLETDGGMPKDGVRTYCCCMVTLFILKPLKDVGLNIRPNTLFIRSSSSSWIVFDVFMGLRFCFIFFLCQKEDKYRLYLTLMNKIQCMYLHSRSLELCIYLNPH